MKLLDIINNNIRVQYAAIRRPQSLSLPVVTPVAVTGSLVAILLWLTDSLEKLRIKGLWIIFLLSIAVFFTSLINRYFPEKKGHIIAILTRIRQKRNRIVSLILPIITTVLPIGAGAIISTVPIRYDGCFIKMLFTIIPLSVAFSGFELTLWLLACVLFDNMFGGFFYQEMPLYATLGFIGIFAAANALLGSMMMGMKLLGSRRALYRRCFLAYSLSPSNTGWMLCHGRKVSQLFTSEFLGKIYMMDNSNNKPAKYGKIRRRY